MDTLADVTDLERVRVFAEGEVEQAGGAATSMKYIKTMFKKKKKEGAIRRVRRAL